MLLNGVGQFVSLIPQNIWEISGKHLGQCCVNLITQALTATVQHPPSDEAHK